MGGGAKDPFDRLSPALRYHVVNSLGFAELRPVQGLTVDAVLDGANCVVLAPTAGGKTEAAFFPLLSAMDEENWPTPSVIYLSPIKALLNNQEPRLERLAGMMSRRVFKWHGDVGPGARKKFLDDPADILMTTPESLEVMLISAKVPSKRLFAELRAVVIDEVHAFASDDRGAHLVSLLERLTRFCGRDVQRIGLSATVGNPEEILGWLQGTSQRPGRFVDPPKANANPALHIDYVATLNNAAKVIKAMHPGAKRLVFVDSRRRVEQLGEALQGEGVDTYVTHSSLSADERRQAELAFESGQNCAIVATSTMELGIDVGDLDAVFQIDSPPSVASFLQRMGRTGRRPGSLQNCTFLCTKTDEVAICAAMVRLSQDGYVEPVRPEDNAFHVLAQQLMALVVQQGGIPVSDWWSWLSGAASFASVTEQHRELLVEKMLAEDILYSADGRLSLGQVGERLYGRRYFMPLFAVFESPPQIKVCWGPEEIGTIDALFLQTLRDDPSFILGGRPWMVTGIDWQKGRCDVTPAPAGAHLRWHGMPRLHARVLAQAVRQLIVSDDVDPWWSRRASAEISAFRAEHAFCADSDMPLVQLPDRVVWHTFLGGKANNLLARLLEERLGEKVVPGNFSIELTETSAESFSAVNTAIRELMAPDAITHQDTLRHAEACVRGRLSKFQPCLPRELELNFLSRRVVEIPVFGPDQE